MITSRRIAALAFACSLAPASALATDVHFGTAVSWSPGASVEYASPFRLGVNLAGMAYADGVTGRARVSLGTVAGQTVAWNTPVEFNNSDSDHVVGCALDASTAVFAWYDVAATQVQARVGTISGGVISFPTAETVVSAAQSTGFRGATSITCLDATHFVVTYRSTTTEGAAKVGTVSATAISLGAQQIFSNGNLDINFATSTRLDATHVFLTWNSIGSNLSACRLGVISGNDFAATPFGVPFSYNGGSQSEHISATQIDGGHVLLAFRDVNTSQLEAQLMTYAGADITGGGLATNLSVDNTQYVSLATLGKNVGVVAWRDNQNTAGQAMVVRTSGTTILGSCGEEVEFSDDASYIGISALDSSRLVFGFYQSGGANESRSRVGFTVDSIQVLNGMETGDATEFPPTGGLGSATFDSTTVRPGSGTFSLRQTATTVSSLSNNICTSGGNVAARFSFRTPAIPASTQTIASLRNRTTTTEQWKLSLTNTGRLQASQTAAIGLTTTSGATVLVPNTWYTISLAYGAEANGPVLVWLDNGTLTQEIETTHSSAGADTDQFMISGPAGGFFFDDFYITDGRGRPPKGQIVRIGATADGLVNNFNTPGSAPRALSVDEVAPDGATSQNQHTVNASATELYVLADPPAGAARYSAKPIWQMLGGSTGGSQHGLSWAIESSIGGEEEPFGSTFVILQNRMWQVAPDGRAWSESMIDSLQLGGSHLTGSANTAISYVAAMVDYGDAESLVTANELLHFGATGVDRAIELSWQTPEPTGGFHVWRAPAASGPWERVTDTPVEAPLGSSEYAFEDGGLRADTRYFYELEDAGGQRHGPASAITLADADAGAGSCGCRLDGTLR